MKASGAVRLALLCLAIIAGSLYQVLQRQPSARGAASPAPRPSAVDAPAPTTANDHGLTDTAAGYDLEGDERRGGHTIARHVDKTDDELAARLRREPQIGAASTYTDLATARRAVSAVLEASRSRVDAWEARDGSRPNLVLRFAAPRGRPLGRSLERGRPAAEPATRALVVLRWQERQHRWYVLTSYPEGDR